MGTHPIESGSNATPSGVNAGASAVIAGRSGVAEAQNGVRATVTEVNGGPIKVPSARVGDPATARGARVTKAGSHTAQTDMSLNKSQGIGCKEAGYHRFSSDPKKHRVIRMRAAKSADPGIRHLPYGPAKVNQSIKQGL